MMMHGGGLLLRMGTHYHPETSVQAMAGAPEVPTPTHTSAKPQSPEPSDAGTECDPGRSGFAAPDLSSNPDHCLLRHLCGTPGH